MKTQSQNIAVIGAGISGLMSAYSLMRAGHRITLYDKQGFNPPDNASYIAGGMLAPFSEVDHMTPDFIQASLDSLDLWRDFVRTVPDDIAFSDCGSLLVSHQEDMHMLDRFITHLQGSGLEGWHELSRVQIMEKESDLPSKFARALFLPEEAAIHPQQVMKALVRLLRESDAVTLKQEEAVPADIAEDYDYVIDCRGMGAQQDVPNLRGIKGEIAIVHNPALTLRHTVRIMHPRYPLYIVPRPGNIYMIGATQIEGCGDPRVSLRSTMELLSSLYSLHPSFADARVEGFYSGVRPAYPDNVPRLLTEDNIIHFNGTYRHGYLLAPIMAQAVCALVQQQKIDVPFISAKTV